MVDRLRSLDIGGVIYVSDNDEAGDRKADQYREAAKAAGLRLIVVRAADAFPGCPPKGSIDDQENVHLAVEQVLALATSQRTYDETPSLEGPSDLSQQESQSLLRKLEQLAAECDRLFAGDSKVAAADRLIHLRAWCKDSGLFLRDSELQAKLHEARARAAGSVPVSYTHLTLPTICSV